MPTGKGDVDFPALVAILKKIGYEGSLTIERESYGDPNRVREIAEIKQYLEALVGAED
jgi:sugar phosphate isomerase/epimerase